MIHLWPQLLVLFTFVTRFGVTIALFGQPYKSKHDSADFGVILIWLTVLYFGGFFDSLIQKLGG